MVLRVDDEGAQYNIKLKDSENEKRFPFYA